MKVLEVLLERRDRHAHLLDGLSGLLVSSGLHCINPNYDRRSLAKMGTDGLGNKVRGATPHRLDTPISHPMRMDFASLVHANRNAVRFRDVAGRARVSALLFPGDGHEMATLPVAALASCRRRAVSDRHSWNMRLKGRIDVGQPMPASTGRLIARL